MSSRKRRAEGRSNNETLRCLKRAIARDVFNSAGVDLSGDVRETGPERELVTAVEVEPNTSDQSESDGVNPIVDSRIASE